MPERAYVCRAVQVVDDDNDNDDVDDDVEMTNVLEQASLTTDWLL